MKYLIVIERTDNNYSAFSPDVPGCIATGITIEEVRENIAQALAMHLTGLAEDGLALPIPVAQADYVTF